MYQCNYEYLNNTTTKVIYLRRKLNQVCVHSAKFRTEPDWREKAVLLFCQMPKLIYVENVEPEMTRKTAWPFSALKIISKSIQMRAQPMHLTMHNAALRNKCSRFREPVQNCCVYNENEISQFSTIYITAQFLMKTKLVRVKIKE